MTAPVLVAGSTGLLGRELVSRLAASGVALVTASRTATGAAGHQVADLTVSGEAQALLAAVQPAAVVVLAGGAAADAAELYRRNVLPTLHLLEAAAATGLDPYFIVLGSAAEYGEGGDARLREDHLTAPVSEYGRAKLAQTVLARAVADRRNLAVTILRPFNIVSPRLSPDTALGNWRQQLLAAKGGSCEVRGGRLDQIRDFVPAAAVAETAARLLRQPRPGLTLNVCSGIGLELRAVLSAMARRAGCALRAAEDALLAEIPAARRVVGDPRLLGETLGLSFPMDAEGVARQMLA
jgi:nucleoside-diphosphate-sugar epimerase